MAPNQLFVRDLQGSSRSCTASSYAELVDKVTSALDLPNSDSTRFSYASRPIDSQAAFERLPQYATIDTSLRLRGGGPKKRCAHVMMAKSASASGSGTPSGSGVSTPKQQEAAVDVAAAAKAATKSESSEGDGNKAPEVSAAVAIQEPIMERCSSAALRMIGDCPRCEKSFCGAHRLPEDHTCPALANFRKAAFDENRAKLEKEATTSSKISAF